jgi:hypothetical protein
MSCRFCIRPLMWHDPSVPRMYYDHGRLSEDHSTTGSRTHTIIPVSSYISPQYPVAKGMRLQKRVTLRELRLCDRCMVSIGVCSCLDTRRSVTFILTTSRRVEYHHEPLSQILDHSANEV